MANNIGNLVDTNQFAEFYFDKLKEKLNLTDINLNRLGFVGFFIELLGNVQYDVKGYYDHLFNESFPISATDNTNLLYHSAVFGYSPELAKPAEIVGIFNIDPILTNINAVSRRELVLKDISFIIDNIEFHLDSNYTIVYSSNSDSSYMTMNVEILYKNIYDIVPVLYSNSKIKTVGLLQYSRQEIQFGTSNYSFGSHYIYDIPITDYLYELSVDVQLSGLDFTSFKVLPIKEFASDDDPVVFYNILPDNTLRLYFGSGIKGMYVPGKTVNLIIKTTKAEKGNIGQHIITAVKGVVDRYDYDNNNNIISYPSSNDDGSISTNASSVLTLDIINGLGGKNPATEDVLRRELLKYIQTRDNLVSDTDFHNNLKTYSKDSEILFKKTEIAENIIYLYGRILNKYLYPIYTLTETILRTKFEQQLRTVNNKKYVINPTFNIYGNDFNCPFYFEYNSLFNTYDGYIYYETIDFFPSESPVIGSSIILPKDLFITLAYNKVTDITRIYIKTNTKAFDKIASIKLECQLLNISTNLTKMTSGLDDFEHDAFFYDYTGVISKPTTFKISLNIPTSSLDSIFYIFNDIQNVFNQIQSLRLKFYTRSTIQYLMNVPLVYSDEYNRNKLYYTDTIKAMFDNMNLKENRMISDEVQFRFLNTYSLNRKFTPTLLKQGQIFTSSNLITDQNINNWSKTAEVAQELSLLNSYAYVITDNNTTSTLSVDNSISVLNNNDTYTTSVYIEKTTGGTSPTLGFNCKFLGGIEPIELTPRFNSDVGVGNMGATENLTGWWRWQFPITNNNTGNTTLAFKFLPATGFHNSGDNVAATGSATISSMQLELGEVATPFINSYDIDIVLPFKVSINVSFSKQEVIIQKLRIEEIINNLRFAVSKHIMETTTGLNLNFYRSKIADICHNFQGVKSVLIKLTDANNKPIPQSSIETVDKESFIDTTDKVTYLHYTPIFWWFDVNNIVITTTML
jgi:hypothetical protein